MSEENVKVAVRVRPFNDREKARKATLIIEMRDGRTTLIRDPSNMSSDPKQFAFDFSYWSHDGFKTRADGGLEKDSPKYSDQMQVFNDLGRGVLENAWKGYNCSLFAYGQTGSGKSYSMVGYGVNKGIVPVACEELFKQIDEKKTAGVEYQVAVSMLEIYCEKVRDLLDPNGAPKGGLKVREHPKKGFYVENLISAPVNNYKAIEAKIDEGTRNRTVAATQMNATSSRAHTIVQINFTQKGKNSSGENTTKTSCINLVDLAGSERQTEAGTEGDRLKEGIVINQSLSTLGRCIKALADQQMSKGKGKGGVQVPFRDSVLTSLLKNALGGNSKTVMIAALSPADINYEETLSTLRFADRAKSIKTQAVVNESATDRMIRELREENQRLLDMLKNGGNGGSGGVSNEELDTLRQQLDKNKVDMVQMEQTWQQRLAEEASRSKAMSPADRAKLDAQRKTMPHIWNLNEDTALTDMIVHFIKPGEMRIGNNKAQPPADILLNGLSIQKEHAKIRNSDNKRIILTPIPGARMLVNGKEVTSDRELFHNDRVLFGTNYMFVFAHPLDLEKRRKAGQQVDQVTYDMAQSEIAENTGIMGLARQNGGGTRTKEDMILEEELVRLLPQVYQANAMSDELKKNVNFEIVLVAPQAKGLKSGPTEIYTKMHNPMNDNEFFWDKNKFINRFYGMQELYQNYMEGYSNWDVSKDRDPFFESPESEVPVGTVHVFLQSLAYMVEIDEQLPITDFKGNERGQLKVALMPCSPQGKEITGEFVDQPEELVGKNLNFKVKILNAFGLPRKFISSRCRYKFYLDDKESTSLEVSGSNPPYGHEKTFSFKPVTKQLVEYLKDHALVVEILGKQSDKNVPGGGRRNVPQAGQSDQTGYKNKADKLEAKLDKIQRLLNEALTSENKTEAIKSVQQALKEEEMANAANGGMDLNGNEGWNEDGVEPPHHKPKKSTKKKRAKSVDLNAPPSAVSKTSKNSDSKESKPRKKHSESSGSSKEKNGVSKEKNGLTKDSNGVSKEKKRGSSKPR